MTEEAKVNEEVEPTETPEEVEAPTEADESTEGEAQEGESEERLLAGKFKTPEDLEKSYQELQSQYGKLKREKSPEAPEDYEFNFSEDEALKNITQDWDPSEDPLLNEMKDAFKESGVTQETAEKLVRKYLEHEASLVPDHEAEMKKLGEAGKDMIGNIQAYSSKLDEETRGTIESVATTAEQVKALDKLLKLARGNEKIPTDSSTETQSASELYSKAAELRKQPNFNNSADKMRQYERLMDEAIKLEGGE